MTMRLNLAFIGELINTFVYKKSLADLIKIKTMQLNMFTTHPIFGKIIPLDFELICICLSTAIFKQANMDLFVIKIMNNVNTFIVFCFVFLSFA